MLVVTPSPSLLTRQLLIGWSEPLSKLMPLCRSASLQTSRLSPQKQNTAKTRLRFFFLLLSFKVKSKHAFSSLSIFSIAFLPVVSTPFLPARPDICLYVRGSSTCPLKVGVRIITRRAGRLTPEERVEVAARTLTRPRRKAPSNTSRSSKVKPKPRKVMFIIHWLRLVWSMRCVCVLTGMVECHPPWHSPLEDGV